MTLFKEWEEELMVESRVQRDQRTSGYKVGLTNEGVMLGRL